MRIKHVLSNPYKLWATQAYASYGSDNYARNANDTRSFNGRFAYSYRAIIGRIATVSDGKKGIQKVYLLNCRSYSVTTSRHQSELWRSVPTGAIVFRVPKMGCWNNGRSWADNESELQLSDHIGNLTHFWEQFATLKGTAQRARNHWRKAYAQKSAIECLTEFTRYAQVFGISKRELNKITGKGLKIDALIESENAVLASYEGMKNAA